MPNLTRRDFIRSSVMGAGAAGVTGLGFDVAQAIEVKQNLRIAGAKEVHSLCPYCAVGCSLVAYTHAGRRRGTRSSCRSRATRTARSTRGASARRARRPCSSPCPPGGCAKPLYRAPGQRQVGGDQLGRHAGRLAQRIKDSRDATFVTQDGNGNLVNRCEGIAFAGGAAF